jgi:hypothetical protein
VCASTHRHQERPATPGAPQHPARPTLAVGLVKRDGKRVCECV